MLKKLIRGYFSVKLIWRVAAAFILGIGCGCLFSYLDSSCCPGFAARTASILAPFGSVLISMLKMAVFPIIFFSLVIGASSLPIKKFGNMGLSVVIWYLLTSVFAGALGIGMAILCNPTMKNAETVSGEFMAQANAMQSGGTGGTLTQFLNDLFMNPFQALAEGRFLGIIVCAILFGLAARAVLDKSGEDSPEGKSMTRMLDTLNAVQTAAFKVIDWIMEYFPIGIFALITVNFMQYGAALAGPYVRIIFSIVAGIGCMVFAVYPLLLFLFCRENPYRILGKLKEVMLTAFLTRSSAATLPLSLATAKNSLRIRDELSSFALPLGATVNMDGACIHLPVFAILAANMFDIQLGPAQLSILLFTVVFASIGAGGVPGGSVFLLFMTLANMNLTDAQVATVVSLAIGINPLLDMFETACNVTGDNVCNYIIAKREKMIK